MSTRKIPNSASIVFDIPELVENIVLYMNWNDRLKLLTDPIFARFIESYYYNKIKINLYNYIDNIEKFFNFWKISPFLLWICEKEIIGCDRLYDKGNHQTIYNPRSNYISNEYTYLGLICIKEYIYILIDYLYLNERYIYFKGASWCSIIPAYTYILYNSESNKTIVIYLDDAIGWINAYYKYSIVHPFRLQGKDNQIKKSLTVSKKEFNIIDNIMLSTITEELFYKHNDELTPEIIRYRIECKLSRFFNNVSLFLELQNKLMFCITGSFVTQVLLDCIWYDSDLDIYYNDEHGVVPKDINDFLIKEGYMSNEVDLDTNTYFGRSRHVRKYTKGTIKIDIIIELFGENIQDYIGNFDLSCVQSYISYNTLVYEYIHLTVNMIAFYFEKNMYKNNNFEEIMNLRINKYEKRGFKITKVCNNIRPIENNLISPNSYILWR